MKKEELYRIFSHIPQLNTERLLLREMRVSDAADMFDYARRADVTEYLTWSTHTSARYTREYLEYLAGRYRIGAHYEWAVVDRASRRMIGTCGFARIDCEHNIGELGYVLHPDFWGRGLAVEAGRAVLDFGFRTLKLHRIEARYMVENTRSHRVMEKLRMQHEGVARGRLLIKGRYRDIGTAAILCDEFLSE